MTNSSAVRARQQWQATLSIVAEGGFLAVRWGYPASIFLQSWWHFQANTPGAVHTQPDHFPDYIVIPRPSWLKKTQCKNNPHHLLTKQLFSEALVAWQTELGLVFKPVCACNTCETQCKCQQRFHRASDTHTKVGGDSTKPYWQIGMALPGSRLATFSKNPLKRVTLTL